MLVRDNDSLDRAQRVDDDPLDLQKELRRPLAANLPSQKFPHARQLPLAARPEIGAVPGKVGLLHSHVRQMRRLLLRIADGVHGVSKDKSFKNVSVREGCGLGTQKGRGLYIVVCSFYKLAVADPFLAGRQKVFKS